MGTLGDAVDLFKCCIFTPNAFTIVLPAFLVAGALVVFMPESSAYSAVASPASRLPRLGHQACIPCPVAGSSPDGHRDAAILVPRPTAAGAPRNRHVSRDMLLVETLRHSQPTSRDSIAALPGGEPD